MQAESLELKDALGRDLFLAIADTPAAIEDLTVPARRFACLLVWDSAEADDSEIETVVGSILRAGLAYVCVWGNDCERLHDFFDATIADPHASGAEALAVVTTWHDGELLEEALWFATSCTRPADMFVKQCTACVLIVIGSRENESALRRALYARSEPAR